MADWNPRANALFLEVVELPPADRPAFLDQRCGADHALRGELDALLAAHAQAGDFLDAPHPDADATCTTDDAPTRPFDPDATHTTADTPAAARHLPDGLLAGRYRLLEPLGEGGMGTVYRAEQLAPVVRAVAVKLIRAGSDSARVVTRFEAERQALAVMDHPHIAKVLDAGTTPTGQPFFVMEVVDGEPITTFADHHKLNVSQRLELFGRVCAAVQHAHQKGIIHRDLKPSNILVTEVDGRPVPKVIDFGLAKALQAGAIPDVSLEATGFGSILGTPLYMAPEQADPGTADIDTRADVYALGVILYELLTGSTPHTRETFRKAALSEVLRIVREVDPPTPTKRLESADGLASIAAVRQAEPGRLARLVRGDLEWVTMKALAKDRDRRYGSAAMLADDVQRFLNHEPVTAGPPSRWYRVRKFVRRNRGAVTAAVAVLVALVGGVIGTTLGLVEANTQRLAAEQEKQRAKDEAAEKEVARAAEEEARKGFERQAFSMQIDQIRTDSLEEQDPNLTLRLRAYRYAQTAAQVPDHSPDLRYHLTAMTLLTAQAFCPLWPRERTEGVEAVYCFPALPEVGIAQTVTGKVRLCDVLTGSPRVELSLPGRHLRFAMVSDDGRVAATKTDELTTSDLPLSSYPRPARYQFWSVADGRLLAETPPPPPNEHDSQPRTFTPDGSRYLTTSKLLRSPRRGSGLDHTANVWDTATGRRLAHIAGNHPSLSPDGKWVVVQTLVPTAGRATVAAARIHSADDGREMALLVDPDGPINWAEFTPGGKHLFTLSRTHARWWDTADWKPAGGACKLANRDEFASVQAIEHSGDDAKLPMFALQWPRRWVAWDDFAVSYWQGDTISHDGGMPILNRGGHQSMELARRGDAATTHLAGTP